MNIRLFLPLIFFAFRMKSQYLGSAQGINLFPEIPHASEWITGVLTTGNIFVTGLNVVQFKKTERRSNAGFLLFPGIFQMALGSFIESGDDPVRYINVAVGATSVLSTAARMLYHPKTKTEKISFAPFVLPAQKSFAGGFSLIWKI